eukprot:11225973-Lingulodinium_polyedra.AAC.1
MNNTAEAGSLPKRRIVPATWARMALSQNAYGCWEAAWRLHGDCSNSALGLNRLEAAWKPLGNCLGSAW